MGKGSQRGSGTVKRQNKKVPHMTLRVGGTKDEQKKIYKEYFGSNRKGKRDMLRRQKAEARFARFKFRADVPYGSGKSFGEIKYERRTAEASQFAHKNGITLKEAQLLRNARELEARIEARVD